MLVGTRLRIVPLEKRHLEPLRLHRNHIETFSYLTSALPVTEKSQLFWYKTVTTDPTKMYFAIENKSGKFIGFVRLDEWDRVNRSIRAGIDIVADERRHGLATECYGVLLKYLFRQLGVHRVWLLVAQFNHAAVRLYEKIGFIPEGCYRDALFRNGEFHDYMIMSLLETEYGKKK
ncbi:hypothetical protein A2Z33_05570 [Candidatus Gottesmanbacteria bacterium RBG_16_52_11]|uniref:N-acetyltransferase domain-containing protein n=1 Tax=Candidatus Gottesmanbacteria bacterium RBG_16_52_11 TaxID=1798374 RepID=A0A1F5YNA9_9BACT|nr:MAG: hypothetical protein A2Z33_05570 [Candidatus Gottesmanbacteria bacterium RBG_16_52_11]